MTAMTRWLPSPASNGHSSSILGVVVLVVVDGLVDGVGAFFLVVVLLLRASSKNLVTLLKDDLVTSVRIDSISIKSGLMLSVDCYTLYAKMML